DGIRDWSVTGVQTCALPILRFEAAELLRVAHLRGRLFEALVAGVRCRDLQRHIIGVAVDGHATLDTRPRHPFGFDVPRVGAKQRSEERRVGKEGRGWGGWDG